MNMRVGSLFVCLAVCWCSGYVMGADGAIGSKMNDSAEARLVAYGEGFTLCTDRPVRLPDGMEMLLLGFGHKITMSGGPPPPMIVTLHFRNHGISEEKTFNIETVHKTGIRVFVYEKYTFIVDDVRFGISLRLRLKRKEAE